MRWRPVSLCPFRMCSNSKISRNAVPARCIKPAGLHMRCVTAAWWSSGGSIRSLRCQMAKDHLYLRRTTLWFSRAWRFLHVSRVLRQDLKREVRGGSGLHIWLMVDLVHVLFMALLVER
ncbi:hypothetical protein P152DRAFT_173790 [Eremomyces bilateralis CBS 781.70]|uniref:Uncharacterized protein n=1 Tax=Eremomyces bilateralis CBS 781.70 TaxID=1392243 RepID=A0A6G1FT25_9PEZI|nr:uncharacterized protein P152DRAFT_173790 [Eremomyces bilateralis CBS 781.70]KAF1809025.1 hypothetical protein P152DRAFT_173790 [Eremomyces bilateralis CBS 781.70]